MVPISILKTRHSIIMTQLVCVIFGVIISEHYEVRGKSRKYSQTITVSFFRFIGFKTECNRIPTF